MGPAVTGRLPLPCRACGARHEELHVVLVNPDNVDQIVLICKGCSHRRIYFPISDVPAQTIPPVDPDEPVEVTGYDLFLVARYAAALQARDAQTPEPKPKPKRWWRKTRFLIDVGLWYCLFNVMLSPPAEPVDPPADLDLLDEKG